MEIPARHHTPGGLLLACTVEVQPVAEPGICLEVVHPADSGA
jgi:hypothetical protein